MATAVGMPPAIGATVAGCFVLVCCSWRSSSKKRAASTTKSTTSRRYRTSAQYTHTQHVPLSFGVGDGDGVGFGLVASEWCNSIS